MTTRSDIPQIAAILRLAGELLDAHGSEAWDTTIEWDRGVSAQALTGTTSGGGPADPTGNISHSEPDHHREFKKLLERIASDAAQITALVNATNPALTTRPTIKLDESVADDGWCVSCHRDDRMCEPVSERYSGKGWCRWCGDWHHAHGFLPPIDILRDRHRGKRISKQRVDEAIRDHNRTSRQKRRSRKRAA